MLADILDVVKQIGQRILAMQGNEFAIHRKANRDLVTEADLLANQLLHEKLLKICPDAAWLSEESPDDKTRLQKERVFIVDPIDGTREYATHLPEYAISVALIDKHHPVLAVVYNPATDECFYAEQDKGAWLNGKRLHCKTSIEPIHVLVSRSEHGRGYWRDYEDKLHIQKLGSIAYKMALVAAGRADATVSIRPKNEWDIAAGALLVTEAGGLVTNQYLQAIHFNNVDTHVDGIIACAFAIQANLFSLLQAVR